MCRLRIAEGKPNVWLGLIIFWEIEIETASLNPSRKLDSWGGNFIEEATWNKSHALKNKAVVIQSVGVLFLQPAVNTHGI